MPSPSVAPGVVTVPVMIGTPAYLPAAALPISSRPPGINPRLSGNWICLLAVQSALELEPRPPLTGQNVLLKLFHRNPNKAWQSALGRSVAPEVADPMVRPLSRTQPALGPATSAQITSPVWNMAVGSTPDGGGAP